jgi:RNA polymerase sigma-54 factor
LRRRLQCDEERLHEALALIRHLDPDPASAYATKAPDYIVPDVIVTEQDGRYVVRLSPEVQVGARLNQRYVEMFRNCRRGQHPAMAQQLQEARWLVRNAEQRFETILRVAQYIVERQQAFFAAGDIALRPMVLREVADQLDLHESTVSRATAGKYMATPRGCLEFKHFFSRELPMREGPSCSAAAVRTLIQDLIETEQPQSPLSDVDIASALQSQGIRIARRTVSKYRRMLRVPPAEFGRCRPRHRGPVAPCSCRNGCRACAARRPASAPPSGRRRPVAAAPHWRRRDWPGAVCAARRVRRCRWRHRAGSSGFGISCLLLVGEGTRRR